MVIQCQSNSYWVHCDSELRTPAIVKKLILVSERWKKEGTTMILVSVINKRNNTEVVGELLNLDLIQCRIPTCVDTFMVLFEVGML